MRTPRLILHSFFNLAGLGLPLVVAVFTIPLLIQELGETRFGLLTLIWAVTSYFGLFDLGLGRALTHQLSVAYSKNEQDRAGPLIATALTLLAAMGVCAALAMLALTQWGIDQIQAVNDQKEIRNAIFAMAWAMPAVVTTSGLRGILEAQHAFGIINILRIPMGVYTFLGPMLVVLYGTPRLDLVAVALSTGRILACLIHGWFVWRNLSEERCALRFDRHVVAPLCKTGGWMSLSSIISPLMNYLDRFVIGLAISATAVTYYVTPQEIVMKLLIIPGAITAVLFPIFTNQTTNKNQKSKLLFQSVNFFLFLSLLPIVSFLFLFSAEIMSLWISEEFSKQSSQILQIFCIGILINSIAHTPFTLLQSSGASRITAIICLTELPLFTGLAWLLANSHGITGVASAWLLRVIVDTLILFLATHRIFNWPLKSAIGVRFYLCSSLAAVLIFSASFDSLTFRASTFIIIIVASIFALLREYRARHKLM